MVSQGHPPSGLQLQEENIANSFLSDSLLQKQMQLVKQIKTMLEKEKWRLAMMLREFHSRNRMMKIHQIDGRSNCYEVKSPTSFDGTLTKIQVNKR